ncbi:MAG: rod shape-determining protein MreC [Planctomycetes bacterium]|nr:rod shape-determining protein MreC [Planctomycetota bacterium]
MRLKVPRPSKRACLILLLLATFFLVLRPSPIFKPMKMFFVSILAPVQAHIFSAGSKISMFLGDVADRRDLAEENRRLRERVEKLEAALSSEVDRRHALQEELNSLNIFLSRHEDEEIKGVPAHVIGWDSADWRSSIIIDRGAKDGVEKNQPVLWHDFAVGMVEDAWGTTSRVKLLTDPQCRIMARSVRSRAKCIVEGTADGRCRLKYVFDSADIKKNDVLTTTGEHGIFPRHVLVGTVMSVEPSDSGVGLFKKVIVQPRMAPGELESVFVVERLSARVRRGAEGKRK